MCVDECIFLNRYFITEHAGFAHLLRLAGAWGRERECVCEREREREMAGDIERDERD
jgi:hypothetical protein